MAETSFPPSRLSKAQLQARIRTVAMDSARVFFTDHAIARMKKRHLTRDIVLAVLRSGRVVRPPEFNVAKGNIECRMERHLVGHDIAVVVAVSDDDPDLLVITAMTIGA
jgi:hypothetical protein